MTNSESSRKRSFLILHLYLSPHWTRTLLWLLPLQRNLKYRSIPSTLPNSNCLRRIRSPLRTNIILRGNRYHQPILSHPLHRTDTRRMSLRRLLSRQPNPYTILCPPLLTSLHHCRSHTHSLNLPTRNWIKQPSGHPIKLRQNSISPILFIKRHSRLRSYTSPPYIPCHILT